MIFALDELINQCILKEIILVKVYYLSKTTIEPGTKIIFTVTVT